MEGSEEYLPSRAEAIKEINDTVLYLLRKRDLGTEKIEMNDLLDKNLEQNIIINFEGQISIPEYETIVKRLFQGDLQEPVTTEKFELRNLIENELEKLIRKMKMRALIDINYRIFRTFRVPSEHEQTIKNVVFIKYRELAKSMLQNVVTEWMNRGINDDAKLMRAIKLERFELDQKEFNDILVTGKKLFSQGSKSSGGGSVLPVPSQSDAKAAEPKVDDQTRIKVATEKMVKRRDRFLDKFIKPIRFQLVENAEKDGIIYLGYRGIFLGKDVQIKATSQNNRVVQDMTISFSKTVRGQKKTYELNVEELKNIREAGPSGGRAFASKLNGCLNIFDHTSLLEIIWFLIYGISDKNNVHASVVRFFRQNILAPLQELDKTLFSIFVQKTAATK